MGSQAKLERGRDVSQSTDRRTYSIEDVEELCERYRNWGRWGEGDELGTLNFIDSGTVTEAAGLVRTGEVVSCALPYNADGPQNGGFHRTNPLHFMLQSGGDIAIGAQDHLSILRYTDDAVYMPLQCGTQWDALAHIFHDGKMYNGWDLSFVSSSGARRNGIEVAAEKLVGRGILLDIPRHRGVDWLLPGDAIQSEELTECCQATGLEPRRGDIVLIRTGQIAQVRADGDWGTYAGGAAPGLGVSAASWLFEHEVAAFATDTWGTEVLPNETPDVFQPLHLILLVNAGMMIGEIFDLEKLSERCTYHERWEFFLVAAPLPFTGAVGSPLNPLAIL
jgi:kynurenine formamidase